MGLVSLMDIRVAWQACPWPNSTQLQAGPSGLLLQVVFDLDYTLWPFWCEMFTAAQTPWLYPHVPAILEGLQARRIPLAVASRTPTPHVANAFINKLDIRHRFCRQAQPSRTCLLRASSQPGSCSCSCRPRQPDPGVLLGGYPLRGLACSIQLIPAADGFDQHSAQKDKAHLPNIQCDTGLPFTDMLFFVSAAGKRATTAWARLLPARVAAHALPVAHVICRMTSMATSSG